MKNLLVPVDLSASQPAVVAKAVELARALDGGLWLLHVAEPDPGFVGYDAGPQVVRDDVALRYREEHRSLQHTADELRSAGVDVTALLVQGATVETILTEAERLEADLIVMGSHGHGALYQALLGSVSSGVLSKTRRPVLIVPARDLGA
jgi:nucleotide-binding universal stress UspA family protein